MTTLQTIADRAGLSKNTVGRILRGELKGLRVDATQRALRVRRLADQLGYRPNAIARAMSEGRFGCIALLLSTSTARSNLSMPLLAGIHDALAQRNLQLIVARLPDEQLTDDGFVPQILREMSCDGLLINYTDQIPGRMIELIEKSRQPVVWINVKRLCDCVHPDDIQIGRLATERLLERGHRRIAFVDRAIGDANLVAVHYSRHDRYEGYCQAMRSAGLEPWFIKRSDGRHEPSLADLMARPDRPTALVAQGSLDEGQLAEATVRLGLEIPRDLAIISFSIGEWQHIRGKPISHALVPFEEVGARAVSMLIEKMRQPQRELPAQAVEAKLIEAGETGA